MQETKEVQIPSLGWENPLEEEMATCFSILIWKIPWTEEAGRLQTIGSQRTGHDGTTKQQRHVDLGQLFETVFVRFSHCKHTPPSIFL